METKTPTPKDAALLAALTPDDRRLVEGDMATYPNLSADEAIWILAAFGGLELTSPEARKLIGKG